jgi:Cu/Ag efflux protein CusF
MRKLLVTACISLLATLPVSAETAKENRGPGGLAAAAVTINATVQAINYDTREVTLKREDGKAFSMKVGPEARNFNQVKVGDNVTFEYMEALAIDVRKAGGTNLAEPQAAIDVARAPKGEKPAAVITETVTIEAQVTAIDHKSRMVTLTGPQGNSMTFKVGEQAKRFGEIKTGDKVVVDYVEAMGISVTTPKG